MAKPRPPDTLFTDNPQLTRVLQDIYDLLTDDTDTVYDDAEVTDDVEDLQGDKLQTASYTEKFETLTIGSSGSWVSINLSGYGVEGSDIAEICIVNDCAADHACGARTSGSSVERKSLFRGGTSNQDRTLSVVAVGGNATVEIYVGDRACISVYLIGYWRYSTN